MITFLLTSLLGVMLIGIPILLSIALIGFVGMTMLRDVVMPLFAQKMFAQLDSFTLLAMPYFILAGSIMTAGGISRQLVDFARALVGHFRAGLAHASIVGSMVMSGVSGSSTADAVGDRIDHHPRDETDRLQTGLCCRLDRDCRDHGRDHPAEHDDGRLRCDCAGLDRRTVPWRYHPRHPDRARPDGDREALHLSPEVSGAAPGNGALRPVRAVALGALGVVRPARAADHRRRHPVRRVHRDRGGRGRVRLCTHHRLYCEEDHAEANSRTSSSTRRSPPRWCPASSRCPDRWAGSSRICNSTRSSSTPSAPSRRARR